MIARIGTYGAQQAWIARIGDMQVRLQAAQRQVSSGQQHQDWSELGARAGTVIGLQNQLAALRSRDEANASAGTSLAASSAALDSVVSSVSLFSKALDAFAQGNTKDPANIASIQQQAFQQMTQIQSFLGTSIGGAHLFSGGRTDRAPVDFKASTLSDFQTKWDGAAAAWPTTRAAQLGSASADASASGGFRLDGSSGVLSAGSASAFSFFSSGASVVLSGAGALDGTRTARPAALSVGGTALSETNGAGSGSPSVTIAAAGGAVVVGPAATGDLDFSFAANGNLVATPKNPGALSQILPGMRFTVSGSAGGAWDGSFAAVAAAAGGGVEFMPDTKPAAPEILSLGGGASVSVAKNGGAAVNPAGTRAILSNSLANGRTYVTFSSPGTNDFAGWAAGDKATISGTEGHDGTWSVFSATPDSITFAVSGTGLRLSTLLPQTGRADPTLSWGSGTSASSLTASGGSGAGAGAAGYGSLSFSPQGAGGETIQCSGPGSFADASGNPVPPAGAILRTSSPSGVNDGSYMVVSNTGTTITIAAPAIATGNSPAGTAAASSWYQGDALSPATNPTPGRSVAAGIQASDPGIERAIRAMGLIAQGRIGTAGGLDENQGRTAQAQALLKSALGSSNASVPGETPGNLVSAQESLGWAQAAIASARTLSVQFSGALTQQLNSITQADPNAAVAALVSETQALQASYASWAKVQGMSLIDYLK